MIRTFDPVVARKAAAFVERISKTCQEFDLYISVGKSGTEIVDGSNDETGFALIADADEYLLGVTE